MARFIRAGRNWEGRSWTLNPALDALASLIEEAWPERKSVDGTVASRTHDATNPGSDHRPYPYSGSGVVYALDMGEVTEDDGFILAEQLRLSRDPRIKYVIHEGRMFSSYTNSSRQAWQWGGYGGANDHVDHVHVSVWRTAGPGDWAITLGDDMAHPPTSIRDWRNDHSVPDVPDWAGWDDYVAKSGTFEDSGKWPAGRADLAWFFHTFVEPLQADIAALQAEVSRQAAEIQALRNQGSGPHSHSEYVEKGRSYRIG